MVNDGMEHMSIEEYEEDLERICAECGDAYAEPNSNLCSLCKKELAEKYNQQ